MKDQSVETETKPIEDLSDLGERGKEQGFCCNQQCVDCTRWCKEE